MTSRATTWPPRIIAHRGGVGCWPQFPENSRDAFDAAAAAGFDSECDVWPSADGIPIVIHDATLRRTTNLRGRVSDYQSDQLRTLGKLSLLSEVAHVVSLVEIKPPNAPQLVRSVIDIMRGRQWTLMSFGAANLLHALKYDPSVEVAFLIKDSKGAKTAIANKWPAYLNYSLIRDRIVIPIREARLPVGVWTVNKEKDLRRISVLKPDVIISDVPRSIQQWLGSLRR